jgi:putative flippase GtrA
MKPSAVRLLTPEGGLLGQGVRFALTGALVTVVYLVVTSLLAVVVGLPFEVALPIGFGVAIALHFTLQRQFVWMHREQFALPFGHQAARYLLAAGVQYSITALATWRLPSVLGVAPEVVYLFTVPVVAVLNFLVFRHVIFHAGSSGPRFARSQARVAHSEGPVQAPHAEEAQGEPDSATAGVPV